MMKMNVRRLVKDLEKIRQACSDKDIDLDEVDENLMGVIEELKLTTEYLTSRRRK